MFDVATRAKSQRAWPGAVAAGSARIGWMRRRSFGSHRRSPSTRWTVFTDVDCGLPQAACRIAQYLERGIAVNYVAYPRSGPGTESWGKMESVWCSKDARDALTRAKLGQDVPRPATCAATPIAAHYALGQRLALSGTPTILLPDGRSFGGYVGARVQLAARRSRKKNDQAVAKASGATALTRREHASVRESAVAKASPVAPIIPRLRPSRVFRRAGDSRRGCGANPKPNRS